MLTYDYRRTKIESASAQTQGLALQLTDHFKAKSFFWQPWLAQVSTSMNASVMGSLSKVNSMATTQSRATSLTGDAGLNLVKYSRFPFEAHLFRDDIRSAPAYTVSNRSIRNGYSLDQSYKTKRRNFYTRGYFVSTRQDGTFNIGPLFSDMFTYSARMTPAQFQSVVISGQRNRQYLPVQGQRFKNDTLLVSHLYQPNMSFSVATIVNTSKLGGTTESGGATRQDYDAASKQFSSLVSIRPERSPLTVTGSVRYFGADRTISGISSPTVKFSNFNLGANYLFSPLVRLYGSVDVSDSNGTQTIYTNTALTAAKPFKFKSTTGVGGYRYSGSVGGTIFNNNLNKTDFAGQSSSKNTLGVKVYLSHALDKTGDLGGGKLTRKLYQTITLGYINNASQISSLNSGGSLTWNRIKGRESTLFRLTALDSRKLRGAPFVFQMVNLQATRNQSMNSHEYLTGSLTVQATHMESNTPSPLFTIAPSTELAYVNQRLFQVRNFSLKSMLHIRDSNIAPTQIQSYENQAMRSWENILEYRIGLLAMKLTAKAARIHNQSQSLLQYTMSREF